jgi:hypothetical protein
MPGRQRVDNDQPADIVCENELMGLREEESHHKNV